jgi:bifunctional DNA-binding transcriptional regulator/antitoxin component of YhaV-PrlF toxin-antitoxin module
MLQSQISRVHKGKEYVKFWIVVPHKFVHSLGWKTGEELEAEIKGGKLLVRKEMKK